MIILLIFIAAAIVFTILMIDDIFYNSFLEIDNPFFEVIGVIIDFLTAIMLICYLGTCLSIPYDTYETNIVYENLIQRKEISSTTDVHLYEDIMDWNTQYEKYKYKSESKWISCFYPKEVIENVDVIEYEIP